MSIDSDRIMKLVDCSKVDFMAKDKHGDTVFVHIEGKTANNILKILQMGIENKEPTIFTKEVAKSG